MKKLYRFVFLAVLGWANLAVLPGCSKAPPLEESNELRLGAASEISGPVEVPISAPATLKGMNTESLGAVRARLTAQIPGLMAKSYAPVKSIFEKIDPALEWESAESFYLFGPGSMCGVGPALDSDLIFNPYMLLGARFFGLGMKQSPFRWSQATRDSAATGNSQIPMALKPVSLSWIPKESRAELLFRVSNYLQEAEPWLLNPIGVGDVVFSLSPLNARDLGFKFMRIDTENSSNIVLPPQPPSALQLLEIFTPRQLKSSSARCNSSGWPYKTYRNLKLRAVPAKLRVLLWRSDPRDLGSPDFSYDINFD